MTQIDLSPMLIGLQSTYYQVEEAKSCVLTSHPHRRSKNIQVWGNQDLIIALLKKTSIAFLIFGSSPRPS